MQRMRRIAFVAGLSITATALGQGELFGQIAQWPPPIQPPLGIFANTEGSCHSSSSPIFAEDFSFANPTIVSTVRWWGWAASDCGLTAIRSANVGVNSFTVTLYKNVAESNVPGDLIWTSGELDPSAHVASTLFGSVTSGSLVANVYQYTVALPQLPAFSGKAWVSISAKSNTGSSWVWALQGDGDTIETTGTGTAGERAETNSSGNWVNNPLTFSLAFAVLGPLDSDGDGLDDLLEAELQGNTDCPGINNPDSDGDSLSDGVEVLVTGTDPCDPDSDDDGIPDNIDPDPLSLEDPTGPAEFSQIVADDILDLGLASFSEGSNENAKTAYKRVLASRMNKAASLIAKGSIGEAIDVLNSVLDRVDGFSSPPDWIDDPIERPIVYEKVWVTIDLISNPS